MLQDFSGDLSVLNDGDHAHRPVAAWTSQSVDAPGAPQQRRPCQSSGAGYIVRPRQTHARRWNRLDFDNGHRAFYIYAPVRPTEAGSPGPVSPTDKKLALAKSYDGGGALIAWIDLTPDGSVTIHPLHTAEQFEKQFKSTLATDNISVAVYDGAEYKNVGVAKTEKRFFEAAVVSVMNANGYEVTPVVDPAVFR